MCLFYAAQEGTIRDWVEIVKRQFGVNQSFWQCGT
jgi:hypothetical protein